MANAFEYGDALLPQPTPDSPENTSNTDVPTSPQIGSNQPYLNLATFVLFDLSFFYNHKPGFYSSQVPNGRSS